MLQSIRFENKVGVKQVFELLHQLPNCVHPTHYSFSERLRSKKDETANTPAFFDFVEQHPSGCFLHGKSFKVNVDVRADATEVDFWFRKYLIDPSTIFETFNLLDPLFGYACDYSELEHRNRVCRTFGNSKWESWVGRSSIKWIPGLYWYTYLSKRLLERVSFDGSNLDPIADSIEQISGDSSALIVKLFEKHNDWESFAKEIDEFCDNRPGLFSKLQVIREAETANDRTEYSNIIWSWR